MTFPVLFVCICVLNNCHRVAIQLQLNIYIYIYIYIYLYHIISLLGAHHIIHVSGVGINNRNIYVLFYVLIFSVVGLQY